MRLGELRGGSGLWRLASADLANGCFLVLHVVWLGRGCSGAARWRRCLVIAGYVAATARLQHAHRGLSGCFGALISEGMPHITRCVFLRPALLLLPPLRHHRGLRDLGRAALSRPTRRRCTDGCFLVGRKLGYQATVFVALHGAVPGGLQVRQVWWSRQCHTASCALGGDEIPLCPLRLSWFKSPEALGQTRIRGLGRHSAPFCRAPAQALPCIKCPAAMSLHYHLGADCRGSNHSGSSSNPSHDRVHAPTGRVRNTRATQRIDFRYFSPHE